MRPSGRRRDYVQYVTSFKVYFRLCLTAFCVSDVKVPNLYRTATLDMTRPNDFVLQNLPIPEPPIGETKGRLKDCFNEHRRPVNKPTNIFKPTTFPH